MNYRSNENRDPAMYCIRRYEVNVSSPGWRVMVNRHKQLYMRNFHDSTHGGQEAALLAAQQWRDEIVAQHPPMTKRDYNNRLRASNTSGIVGVRLHRCGKYSSWSAETNLGNGKKLSKFFNIDRYGNDLAKELAIAERAKQLEEVTGIYVGNTPKNIVEALLLQMKER